ncbi:putative C6 transcription factor [Aspergillus campestris IBT 28561]|uniref:C6 transcription factor n=1 Tax=Aspergillus campestris (strain IBT 28561) TaxID=1392248 RepID=A0A2I1CRB8_ASPC2|nr:putative C6 transcription factor [Aspergillus campestris IBT 28561]PKY00173.1 putative C6 transcription factor [Aspergillus campestris IBT 28561]
MDDDALPGLATSRRRRPALSCTICRRRKLKCDRSIPCEQCIKSKSPESCVYVGPQSASSARQSHREQSQSSTGRGSPVHGGLHVFDSKHLQNSSFHFSSSSRVTKPQRRSDELSELRSRVQGLERALTQANPISTPETTATDTWSDSDVRQTASNAQELSDAVRHLPGRSCFRGKACKTRFGGRSHWAVSLSLFKDIGIFLKGQSGDFKNRKAELCSLSKFKNELWSREKQDHQRTYREKAFALGEILPPRRVADELLNVYLATFETTYRILHTPSFVEQYEAYWNGTGTTDMVFLAKLLALMAASSGFFGPATRLSEEETLHTAAAGWIVAVDAWLASTSVSSSIEFNMLQIQCLLLIARQAGANDGDLVWIASGSVIRSAMTMGLHRSPSRFPKIGKFWAEMRRRLWATILELDLQSALDGGMVTQIDLDEYDCEPPSNYDDADLTEKMTEDPIPQGLTVGTRSSFQVLLARSLPLRVRIAKLVNRLKFTLSYDDALRMSEQIQQYLEQAATLLEERSFARNFYDFLMRRFLLVLHRPFALSIFLSPQFSYSRKVCLENSLEMLSSLNPPAVTLPEAQACPHLGQLSGAMFRDEFFHAAITICVELSLQANEFAKSGPSPPSGPLNALNDLFRSQQDVLVRAVEHTIDTFGSRMSSKGKGGKPFFFLSMGLASVKARLDGKEDPYKSVEQVSARVIQQCNQILNGATWADVRRAENCEVPPLPTPGLYPATPELSMDPASWPSTGLSPLDFGNIFDTGGDYGLPEFWNSDFFTGF